MKTMDLDTSKELAAAEEEEAVMENKKIRTDCKITELQICSKEPSGAAVEEDQAAAAMESKKFCTGCRTTKTPLWRVGPSGPKSLCNACGIRYRKKKKTTPSQPPASNSRSRSTEEAEKEKKMSKCLNNSVKMSLVILGKDWLLETTSVGKKQRRRQRIRRELREEEIAAASLVALSCGSVFA